MTTTPAVAIPSLVINAYKHRSVLTAQDADVAQTTVDVTYVRFTENIKTQTHVLNMLTTDTLEHSNKNRVVYK